VHRIERFPTRQIDRNFHYHLYSLGRGLLPGMVLGGADGCSRKLHQQNVHQLIQISYSPVLWGQFHDSVYDLTELSGPTFRLLNQST
jgi:hypothetical protein